MCPYAIEAMLGLLSLGMTLSEVHTLTSTRPTPHSPPITNSLLVARWLEVQEDVSKHEYDCELVTYVQVYTMTVS